MIIIFTTARDCIGYHVDTTLKEFENRLLDIIEAPRCFIRVITEGRKVLINVDQITDVQEIDG